MHPSNLPLAARMRPKSIEEYVGQTHLLGEGKPLQRMLAQGHVHSLILWGPPGTGKTTLAQLLAQHVQAHFESLSAVLAGVKEIRGVVEQAQQRLLKGIKTLVFIDEIHRFNKAQQDALLPHVEQGTFILVGATTENPSFELNNALLSRTRVYVLKSLSNSDIEQLIKRALSDSERGLGAQQWVFPDDLLQQLAAAADGDARRALNLLELLADLAELNPNGQRLITEVELAMVLQGAYRRFDKGGDYFYEQISALHKAVRGSAPDAALYWLARMLDGGCDPSYIARRIVRMATEDIGNADPRALDLALAAWDAQLRLGSPEGELALAQAIVYLACAAKSNAVYTAWHAAQAAVKQYGSLPVPNHLCNAPTPLLKSLGKAKAYRYAHDEPEAYAAGENYFPEDLPPQHYYHPVERGLEIKIAEKLAYLRKLDKQASQDKK